MNADGARRSALIVASDEYADLKLRRLRAPVRDAEELARVLSDPEIGDFDVDVVLNEPEHRVRRKLSEFFANRTREDLLLLHFSCHGLKDDDGSLYFATPDSDVEHLDSTAVSAEFVNRQMRRSRSRRIALFLDCCYSGAFSRGVMARAGDGLELAERFDGQGQVVITASTATEYAFEGDELTGDGTPSVFTTALVEGLESGAADRDDDGLVSIDELYDFVYDRVREKTPSQTPSKWTYDLQGELYIARNRHPRPVAPAELPLDLREAMENRLAFVRGGAVGELEVLLGSSNRRLAVAARSALEALTDDDSRSVSDAAASALARQAPSQTPEISPRHAPGLAPSPPVQRPEPESDAAPSTGADARRRRLSRLRHRRGRATPSEGGRRRRLARASGLLRPPRPAALLAFAGAALLVVGWARIDVRTFMIRYGPEGVGLPLCVAAAAVALVRAPARRGLSAGLILGFGLPRLGLAAGSAQAPMQILSGTGGQRVVLAAGSAAVVLAGLVASGASAVGEAQAGSAAGVPAGRTARVLALLGAGLCLAGAAVPWSYAGDNSAHLTLLGSDHTVLGRLGVLLGIACMVVIAGLLLRRHVWRPLFLSGVLIALGGQSLLQSAVLVWHVASYYYLDARDGLALGLAGGLLLLAAGLIVLRTASRLASTRVA